MRDQQEETHVLVAVACTVVYQNVEALSMTNMNKTNIALFSFPNKEKKAAVYKSWCNEIHKFRRKGGKDGFTITKSTRVCELHFKPDEINSKITSEKKTFFKYKYK